MVVKDIPIKDIVLPEISLRDELNEEKTKELMDSIKAAGLIHPITVRKDGIKYLLITGYRRLTAYKKLGLEKIF